MHIGVLTHNYPRFPGDFSGTFIEALCQEFARQTQRVTIWAPYDPAYQMDDCRLSAISSSIVHRQSSINNRQSSINNRQSSINNRQSSINNRQSSIVNRQSSIVNRQSSINNRPSSIVHRPSSIVHRPSSIDLRLYRYALTDQAHTLGYMRTMQSDLALRRNSYWLGPAMLAAGIAKVTRDARRLRPDLLHAHWLLPNGLIGAVASRLVGIPLVISVPGSDAQVANANPFFRALARFAMRQATLMTANSADLRDAVASLEPSVLHKFDLIIYGTDPAAFKPDPTGVAELRTQWLPAPSQSPGYPFTILCVGRMVYKKGFDTLIRALAEPALRDQAVVAVMVGEGDQKAEWQALAQQVGVADRLRWVGNIPKDQIGVYYNACDVLVNPAVRKPVDGLNVCVLDAMSCGKPVVGSTVAGNPLAIVAGETGFLAPEGDPAALAGALAKLAADPDLRQTMGQAARQRIEAELGWPPLARRYLDHFRRLQR